LSSVTWSQRRLISTITVAILLTIAASQAFVLVSSPARIHSSSAQSTLGNPGTLSVTGTGTVDVQPDRAILSIGISTQAATAQLSVQQNAATQDAVYLALENMGIDKSNIQTTYYNIYTVTTCGCNGTPPVITGYQVTDQLQVTIIATGQDTQALGDRTGQVIDTAVSAGANQVSGVQFTVGGSALQTAQQTALANAAKDASQQAHIIASQLNISVTGVISATTNQGYYQPPPFYYANAFTATNLAQPRTIVSPPNSLTVTETVSVEFSTA